MFQTFNQDARFDEVVLAASLASNARLAVEQRFPKLVGLEQPASPVFARCKAVVVGVGSVGRRLALHLARLGVGVLWLVDPGRYDDRANLITQEILADDLNRSKAVKTGEDCKGVSPGTRVLVYEGKIDDLDPLTTQEADVVFLATDNLAAEVDVSTRFRALGIPIVQASVHGETLVAQVRFLENRLTGAPCLICMFGEEEFNHLNRSTMFSCSGTSERQPLKHRHPLPTFSTSFLCSLAADLAMMQWSRHMLGLGRHVTDTLLQYCGYTHHTTQVDLLPNKNCRCDHTVLERITLAGTLADCSVNDLATAAGHDHGSLRDVSFTLGGLSYVEAAVCLCDVQRLKRFAVASESLGTCQHCGQQTVPQPFYTFRPTPGHVLAGQRQKTLRQLGAETASWAVILSGETGSLITAEKQHHEACNA